MLPHDFPLWAAVYRAGQKVLTLQCAKPRQTEFQQTLCADIDGFSLHAAVRFGADDRQALANDRVQTNAVGQVVPRLKTPWRDGTTHLGCRRWS